MLITGFRCYQPEPSLLAFPINFLPNTFSSIDPLFHNRWQKGGFLILSNLWHFVMIIQWKAFSYQVNLIHKDVTINTSFFQSTIFKILSWYTSSLQRWLIDYYDLTDFYRLMSTVILFGAQIVPSLVNGSSWVLLTSPYSYCFLAFRHKIVQPWIFPAPFNGTVLVLWYALLLDSDCFQAFSMGKGMQYAFLRKIKIEHCILLVFSVKNTITGFLLDFILVSLPLLYKNLGS